MDLIYQLQELEFERELLLKEKKQKQLRGEIQNIKKQYAEAKQKADEFIVQLNKWEKKAMVSERDLTQKEGELEAQDNRLYSGELVNLKEINSCQEKLRQEEEKCQEISESLVKIWQERDQIKNDHKKAEAQVEACQTAFEKLKTEYLQNDRSFEIKNKELEEKIKNLKKGINPEKLTWYEKAKKNQLKPVAIILEEKFCSGCRTALSQSQISHIVREKEIVFCENCGRMICP